MRQTLTTTQNTGTMNHNTATQEMKCKRPHKPNSPLNWIYKFFTRIITDIIIKTRDVNQPREQSRL